MSILVNAIGHSISDSLSALLFGEEAHGPGSPSHFPEVSFQYVSGADLPLQFLGEGVVMEAVVEVGGGSISNWEAMRLIASVGVACSRYQNATLCNLSCKRIQCDEIWLFCYAKQKNLPQQFKGQFVYGDVWTIGSHRC